MTEDIFGTTTSIGDGRRKYIAVEYMGTNTQARCHTIEAEQRHWGTVGQEVRK